MFSSSIRFSWKWKSFILFCSCVKHFLWKMFPDMSLCSVKRRAEVMMGCLVVHKRHLSPYPFLLKFYNCFMGSKLEQRTFFTLLCLIWQIQFRYMVSNFTTFSVKVGGEVDGKLNFQKFHHLLWYLVLQSSKDCLCSNLCDIIQLSINMSSVQRGWGGETAQLYPCREVKDWFPNEGKCCCSNGASNRQNCMCCHWLQCNFIDLQCWNWRHDF